MYAKIRNSEDDIMINTNKQLIFIDLLKRQNIKRANDFLCDKKLLQSYNYPIKIFEWIYGKAYAIDVIRPFRLELSKR